MAIIPAFPHWDRRQRQGDPLENSQIGSKQQRAYPWGCLLTSTQQFSIPKLLKIISILFIPVYRIFFLNRLAVAENASNVFGDSVGRRLLWFMFGESLALTGMKARDICLLTAQSFIIDTPKIAATAKQTGHYSYPWMMLRETECQSRCLILCLWRQKLHLTCPKMKSPLAWQIAHTPVK